MASQLDQDQESNQSDFDLLDALRSAIDARDAELARQLAGRMLDDDALELLEDLTGHELARLFAFLGEESLGQLLARLDHRDAAGILTRMSATQAADLLEAIEPDDATDIVQVMTQNDPETAENILVAMEPEDAAEIRELMPYDEDTAGGMMTPEFVAVYPDLRADETVAALRSVAEEISNVQYVYVIDREEHLLGALSLHKLVLSPPQTPVGQLMSTEIWSVRADEDQEVAARLVTERSLLALPVVDDEGHLLGIITHDDIGEIIEEEATEDMERLGGSNPLDVPYMRATPVLLFRKRIVWLLVLFFAQFITVSIQEHYEVMLAQVTLLAVFIPILIGTGGNVGSQTVSTLIRALAVGEIQSRHVVRIIGKEALTGLLLGIVMGVLMFGRALLVGDAKDVNLAIVVGLTILVLTTWAATVGSVLPIMLSKLKMDPAVVSAPFISSFVDGTGLIIYFTLAGYLLHLG
ncbi:MAG: magnesium transporter [Thermomicrobiales bacterium]|nr:magnesium transporter [Thermomicrobiales bacterium]MCO5218597.1 magnesium transporter [Thermomicrobiales bacterium]MCO5225651.1 magnesium transporter [Thermomicrobiales bacterium]MCO5229255.1 magnesium transporter [Thermomicrobiales bacterium]